MSMVRRREAPGLPSLHEIAPLLDQLGELAEQHLHDPVMMDVEAFDDGDWSAVAQHRFGTSTGRGWMGREVLRYNRERERFELRYIEENPETGATDVVVDRVLDVEPVARPSPK